MGNEEILCYTEEQLQRLADHEKPEKIGEWRSRKNREADERRRSADLEVEEIERKIKKRIYSLIFAYFEPEDQLEEKLLPWNYRLRGRGFSKLTVKKDVERLNLHKDSNIFLYSPTLSTPDRELLETLSRSFADKTFSVFAERNGERYELPIKIKRTQKA